MSNPLLLGVLGIGVLFILGVFIVKSGGSNDPRRKELFSKLLLIKNQIDEGNVNRRDLVVKLDNLMSKALQLRYNNSESCGNNLKRARNLFDKSDYNRVWEVHKIRNAVVHEDRDVSNRELEDAYKTFKTAIYKILG